MEEKFIGTVIWFKNHKGYGFIKWEKNGKREKDLFVHFSDIEVPNYKTVKKDQRVMFSLGKNNRGELKAIHVTPVI